MDDSYGRSWLRGLLERMVIDGSLELQLRSGSVPRFKTGDGFRTIDEPDINMRLPNSALSSLSTVIPVELRENMERGVFCSFTLIALGIGRFKVRSYGDHGRFYMFFTLIQPMPPEGEVVPFVPAHPPPSLKAEAWVEI